jgi:hypothetical protein
LERRCSTALGSADARAEEPERDADEESSVGAGENEALLAMIELHEAVIEAEERDEQHHEAGAERALKRVAQQQHEADDGEQTEQKASDGEHGFPAIYRRMPMANKLLRFFGGGALLGVILSTIAGALVLPWWNKPGSGTAMCDCETIANSTISNVIWTQVWGGLIGGVLALGLGIFLQVRKGKDAAPA